MLKIQQGLNIRKINVVKENIKEHYPNQPQIPDNPCKILIIESSGSRKTSSIHYYLINQGPDISKIYLYAKDLYEAKYHFLINKRKVQA